MRHIYPIAPSEREVHDFQVLVIHLSIKPSIYPPSLSSSLPNAQRLISLHHSTQYVLGHMDQHQSTENNNKDIVKEGQVYNVDLLGIGAQFCEDSKASSLHVNSHQYLYSHPQTCRMIQGMGKLTL
jgi:hypothetical protein